MIALIKKEMFNDRIREILSFVPSAIFPAIIFPAGKIIAGNIADGTNDNISLILSLNISFLIKAIMENLVR